MLRIHLLQNLYNLSDEGVRNEVIDSRAFSDFFGVEPSNQIPDDDTIGRFRNLPINHHIHEKFFALVIKNLTDRRLILNKETIVDFTIIEAPSSTKNKEKQRDPDAHSVKKGADWHFGYKAHIGVDKDSGTVHTLEATGANEHDFRRAKRKSFMETATILVLKSEKNFGCSQVQIKRREHEKSSVRAKVEHVFAVVKGQLQYRKTRYRGLRKQTAKLNMLFALANLILADRPSRLAA